MDYVAIVAYSKRISMRLWGDYVYIQRPHWSLLSKHCLPIKHFPTLQIEVLENKILRNVLLMFI